MLSQLAIHYCIDGLQHAIRYQLFCIVRMMIVKPQPDGMGFVACLYNERPAVQLDMILSLG